MIDTAKGVIDTAKGVIDTAEGVTDVVEEDLSAGGEAAEMGLWKGNLEVLLEVLLRGEDFSWVMGANLRGFATN